MVMILNFNLPSNCPGNIPLIKNGELGPEKILLTIPLVSVSRPGPNITTLGVENPRKNDSLGILTLSDV